MDNEQVRGWITKLSEHPDDMLCWDETEEIAKALELLLVIKIAADGLFDTEAGQGRIERLSKALKAIEDA
ncbi:MAG: hypothetical protein GY938_13340 [Ketobacter sp.]|nr:hypothetical protein [Ketobacter sp.]